ncbi:MULTISPECIES: 3-oxoacyl-ACP reductase FabG [Hydrocarboniphaga]|uniref:3-oxoacyl-[acyl-carrier-protein] reductase n=2 Tax=Hydrocarboniphaga effusa TaxID=243629 RepID=I7Z774_9GAMM|nr:MULTISPECIES: 3-oxoacyl-ACP reductase FabG [Hydrocarboniphaga]EIT67639.1 3-ketoacyl-(acyl-carrier-protein) reductase [Hydrocarboniphaga effusa AP103]MDZ4080223.1 3-oxoacyl-ACP reductase FabG [Hydrocarboniphaga sp.]
MKFEGNVALVTGASRGIGKAIAERLAQGGAKVIGTATSESGAAAIDAWLKPLGGVGRLLNVKDGAAAAALVSDIEKTIGPIAILVNNAGITRDTLALRLKDDDWNDVVETNLSAVFRMSKLVMRSMMKARYGRIISIGSVVGATGNAGQANYAAAKAGLVGMSKSLAAELGSRNVTVNVVAPGFIETDMTHGLPEDVKTKLLERITLQRLGSADEVASAVAFLASSEAGYITGHTLHVNGGMFMG